MADHDLYRLFPLVIRTQSLLASGLLEETDTQESILKKICYALEEECDLTAEEITQLKELADPETCPSRFLPYLAATVASEFLGDWSEDRQRMVINATVLVWMAKGTMRGFRYLLQVRDWGDRLPWELWKRHIYETFDYWPRSEAGSGRGGAFFEYAYGILSARIDITDPSDATERLSYSEAADRLRLIESMRPAHVLVRPFELATEAAQEDSLQLPVESVLCFPTLIIEEDAPALSDELTLDTTCVHWCQSSCQVMCEYECETGCETGSCETGCQDFCELSCQTYAQTSCLTSCQFECQLAVQ